MHQPTLTARQQGFTLIEVLIALVISAIGLLGIAGMQMFSINNTSASNVRAVAAIEAANLVSRMKGTPDYWQGVSDDFAIQLVTDNSSGDIVIDDIDATADNAGGTLNAQNADCTVDGACDTSTKVVAYDLMQWKTRLDTRLPNAEVSITRIKPDESPRFPIFSINIRWQEKVSAQNLRMKGSYYANSNSDDVLANNVRTLNYRIAVQP